MTEKEKTQRQMLYNASCDAALLEERTREKARRAAGLDFFSQSA